MRTRGPTIRSLLAVVAFAALALFGATMWRRSAIFSARAETHRLQLLEDTLNYRAAGDDAFRWHRGLTDDEADERRFFARCAQQEKQLYERYLRAARFPWIRVGPDPERPSRPSRPAP